VPGAARDPGRDALRDAGGGPGRARALLPEGERDLNRPDRRVGASARRGGGPTAGADRDPGEAPRAPRRKPSAGAANRLERRKKERSRPSSRRGECCRQLRARSTTTGKRSLRAEGERRDAQEGRGPGEGDVGRDRRRDRGAGPRDGARRSRWRTRGTGQRPRVRRPTGVFGLGSGQEAGRVKIGGATAGRLSPAFARSRQALGGRGLRRESPGGRRSGAPGWGPRPDAHRAAKWTCAASKPTKRFRAGALLEDSGGRGSRSCGIIRRQGKGILRGMR